jgi:hypothetical protein
LPASESGEKEATHAAVRLGLVQAVFEVVQGQQGLKLSPGAQVGCVYLVILGWFLPFFGFCLVMMGVEERGTASQVMWGVGLLLVGLVFDLLAVWVLRKPFREKKVRAAKAAEELKGRIQSALKEYPDAGIPAGSEGGPPDPRIAWELVRHISDTRLRKAVSVELVLPKAIPNPFARVLNAPPLVAYKAFLNGRYLGRSEGGGFGARAEVPVGSHVLTIEGPSGPWHVLFELPIAGACEVEYAAPPPRVNVSYR